jgi:hypothetical protein
MRRAPRRADFCSVGGAVTAVLEFGGHMDPVQAKLFLLMTLVSLLFASQLMTQGGAFAALP